MPANSPKPERGKLLDLAQFESLDQAIDRAERVGGKYAEVGEFVLRKPRLTLMTLFFVSALARAQGLHDAIVREIRHGNPHAVFTLMRAYAETAAIILYVKDHPNYVSVVQTAPEELPKGRGRKSMQAIINHARKRFSGFKEVYAELSEIAHFGSLASWASMAIKDDSSGAFEWSTGPFWRDERTALIACAQVLEMAQITQRMLLEFAHFHLRPRPQAAEGDSTESQA